MVGVVDEDPSEPFEDFVDDDASFQSRASTSGREFKATVADFVTEAGATILVRAARSGPYPLDFVIEGSNQLRYVVLAHGTFDDTPDAGLRRTDTVKKLGFDVVQLSRREEIPVIAVTSHLPNPGTAAAMFLADLTAELFDVVATTGDLAGFHRLINHLQGRGDRPDNAPWRHATQPDQLNLFTGAPNRPIDAGSLRLIVDDITSLDEGERPF
jgi:hypothetical protein